MKWTAVILLLLGILMAITNPTMEDFGEYAKREAAPFMSSGSSSKSTLDRTMEAFAGQLSKEFAMAAGQRTDYVIASTFTLNTMAGGEKPLFLGIFKQFIRLR